MAVPKHFDFIPIDANGVTEAVNDALDKADELRHMFRDTISKLKGDAVEAKRKLAVYQEKVHQAIELIDGRNINRAKMLLKVDCEFLRRSLPAKNPSMKDDYKSVYGESIEAMKMLTSKSQLVQGRMEEMNLMELQHEDVGRHMLNPSNRLLNGAQSTYSASGYRSNEIDECAELNKLNALNAIVCHQ